MHDYKKKHKQQKRSYYNLIIRHGPELTILFAIAPLKLTAPTSGCFRYYLFLLVPSHLNFTATVDSPCSKPNILGVLEIERPNKWDSFSLSRVKTT